MCAPQKHGVTIFFFLKQKEEHNNKQRMKITKCDNNMGRMLRRGFREATRIRRRSVA